MRFLNIFKRNLTNDYQRNKVVKVNLEGNPPFANNIDKSKQF